MACTVFIYRCYVAAVRGLDMITNIDLLFFAVRHNMTYSQILEYAACNGIPLQA